jgi:hypothetical protein
VVGIGRVAVDADITAIAAQLDLPFRRVVARLAQALQSASDERRPVALMRHDVVYSFAVVTIPRSKQNRHSGSALS